MNKVTLFLFFLSARIVDIVTTYFATPDLKTETSPLVRVLNMGWIGFIVINIFFAIIVLLLLIYSRQDKLIYLEQTEKKSILRLFDYFRNILFNIKDKNKKIDTISLLLKEKINISVFFYFALRALIVTMIFISILLSINNVLVSIGKPLLANVNHSLLSNIQFLVIVIVFIYTFFMLVKNRFSKLHREK